MATTQLCLLLVGALALSALLLGLWLLWVSKKQRQELSSLRRQFAELGKVSSTPLSRDGGAADLKSAAGTVGTGESFSAQLDSVERRQAPSLAVPRNPAEKYGYVASLADQGMNAVQIADALQMAPAEVEQLLRLANLKQGA